MPSAALRSRLIETLAVLCALVVFGANAVEPSSIAVPVAPSAAPGR